MTREPVRTFSGRSKLWPKVLGAAFAALAVFAVTAAVTAHAGTSAEEGHAAEAAKKILHAADTYAVGSAQAGCPTISELIDAKKLDESERTEDAWGNRFRIVCERDTPGVVSAGPDGRMGTSDDLHFAR